MEKMEDLQLEFEAVVEQDGKQKLACFLKEVEEKVVSMVSFRKSFLKFQLQVETLLKKVFKKRYKDMLYIYIYLFISVINLMWANNEL